MDPSNWRYLVYFVLLILGGAYFAAAETAFSSVNRIRLVSMSEEGNRRASRALTVLDRFDLTLTTLLVGTNVMHAACAAVATIFATHIYNEMTGAGVSDLPSGVTAVATAITTVALFLFSEMIPKSLAADKAEGASLALAGSVKVVTVILYPVSILFFGLSKLTGKLIRPKKEPTVTEEELSTIIETSEEEGVLDEEQSELLQSALEFSETTVADIIILRDDVEWIDASATKEEIFEKVKKTIYSRLPVCRGSLDRPVGILRVTDFLKAYISGTYTKLSRLLHKPYFTNLDKPINELKDEMSAKRRHIAMVRDRSGKSVIGIVTIEDFLEELVGEIYDESDVVNDNFMKLGGNYFRVSGKLTLGELCKAMNFKPTGAAPLHKPIGTWILETLGRIPEEEDTFTWQDLTVEIEEVSQNRVLYATVKLADPMLDEEPVSAAEGGEDA